MLSENDYDHSDSTHEKKNLGIPDESFKLVQSF